MLEMKIRDIIPAVSRYTGQLASTINAKRAAVQTISLSPESEILEKLQTLLSKTYTAYEALERAEKTAVSKKCDEEAAFYYKDTVEARMQSLRKLVDEMEVLTAREAWPMPTYGDITFKI